MKAFICLLCLMLCACAGNNTNSRTETKILQTQGFKQLYFPTSTFTLFALLRPAKMGNTTMHVYIEGDGKAWITRSKPSNDPTPIEPTLLEVAQNDNSAASILYLARPGQYVQGSNARMSYQKYWTSHRLAPEVIDSLNEAIDMAKKQSGAQDVVLVGYSGGGAAAVLLAAKRNDVRFLGTLAANLDIDAWTKYHKVSPLSGSQNPIHFASKVKHIPQRHMSSSGDSIVPPAISLEFCKRIHQLDSCEQVSGVSHTGNWESVWDYKYY